VRRRAGHPNFLLSFDSVNSQNPMARLKRLLQRIPEVTADMMAHQGRRPDVVRHNCANCLGVGCKASNRNVCDPVANDVDAQNPKRLCSTVTVTATHFPPATDGKLLA